jgi:hypothetical protein
MDIVKSVEQFFENLWTNVLKPGVQKAEQVVEVFFKSAESAVENELGVEGLKIVTDAVSAAETAGGTGLEKLAAAQAAIASDLTTANILDVAKNTINVAIEGAVSQFNSSKTPDTSSQAGGTAAGNDNSSASNGTSTDTPGAETTAASAK